MIPSQVLQRVRYIWRHPANRRHRLRSLLRAVGWQFSKRFSGRAWDVVMPGGMTVRCYPDSQSATLLLYCNGLYDYHEMRFVLDYLRPGDRFLDIGANVGIYTLLAASQLGPEGHVDAFEPVPATLVRLRENLERNGLANVQIHAVAVGQEPGSVQFEVGQDAMNHMLSELPASGQSSLTVPCVVLDQHLAGRAYALGKIDIEGAEPLAFRGAGRMLREANPPVWLLEMNGLLQRFGFTEQQFEDQLDEAGFDLAWYDSDLRQLEFGRGLWQDHDNVLAVARSHARQVVDRLEAAPR